MAATCPAALGHESVRLKEALASRCAGLATAFNLYLALSQRRVCHEPPPHLRGEAQIAACPRVRKVEQYVLVHQIKLLRR